METAFSFYLHRNLELTTYNFKIKMLKFTL